MPLLVTCAYCGRQERRAPSRISPVMFCDRTCRAHHELLERGGQRAPAHQVGGDHRPGDGQGGHDQDKHNSGSKGAHGSGLS